MQNRPFCTVGAVCLAALALPAVTRAQTASLAGTVRDANGGLLVNVVLKLTDTAKGTSRATNTDSTGNYQFALLPPGEYQIEASLTGFQSFQQGGIVLQVDERQRLDITL